MKKTNLDGFDLELYYEKLDNGLEVYIVPFKNVNNKYVTFSTKYGSIHSEFIPIDKNKMIKVPDGIAHFLEHKLFEQENGVDPFTFFSERGADANASTNYFKTTYLFSGPDFLDENLNYLLDYVQEPYFTDKNVDKEKGIIEQEIKMYQDDPYTLVQERNYYNLFVKNPYRYPIIGSIESINSITKEDLYTCYNSFYHPSNMFVVVTGNVIPEEIIEIIKSNQNKKEFMEFKEITKKEYKEPNKVFKEKEVIYLNNITIPKIMISYKLDISKLKKYSKDTLYRYFNILFDVKFGSTSKLSQKLKEDNLVLDGIYVSSDIVDNFIVMSIAVESKFEDKIIDLIINELEDIEITESDFERKKKVMISSNILGSDNIFNINSKIMNNVIYYGKVLTDTITNIRKMNIDEMNEIIKNVSFNNKSICILKNKV